MANTLSRVSGSSWLAAGIAAFPSESIPVRAPKARIDLMRPLRLGPQCADIGSRRLRIRPIRITERLFFRPAFIERHAVIQPAPFHPPGDVCRISNILERVRIENDQIRKLAGFD